MRQLNEAAWIVTIAAAALALWSCSPESPTIDGPGNFALTIPPGGVDKASDTVLATLAPLSVLVTRDGVPVPNVQVYWQRVYPPPLAEAVALSHTVTLTNADGIASVVPTMGPRACIVQTIDADARGTGAPAIRFTLESNSGRPIFLRALPLNFVIPTDSSTMVLAGESAIWKLVAGDGHGNAFGGELALRASVTSGGGIIDPTGTQTRQREGDCGATATITFTSGSGVGRQEAAVTSTDLPGQSAVLRLTVVHRLVDLRGDEFDLRFQPDSMEVPSGTVVGWRWSCLTPLTETGCVNHNVTFEDSPGRPLSSEDQEMGTGFVRAFDAPGVYRYRCTHHSQSFTEGMVGVVVVSHQPR